IPDADRQELQADCDKLGERIAKVLRELPAALESRDIPPMMRQKLVRMSELLPDVQIFHKAVDWALKYDEFYDVKQVATARAMLKEGQARLESFAKGEAPWTTATGLIARGYISKIDGSVQPYGILVPASYKPDGDTKHRLDLWCHGRGENLTELAFIA